MKSMTISKKQKKVFINQVNRRFTHIPLAILCLSVIVLACGCPGQIASRDTVAGETFLVPHGNVILALYDGTEKQTAKDNEIKSYLERGLEKNGFKIVYHDASVGVPSDRISSNARGIISWFGDSKMKDADRYCSWLADQIDKGKKVIIFGNFGAYQDFKTEAWVEMNRLNEVFGRLGVNYKANWTSDGTLLEVVSKDPEIVEQKSPVDLMEAGHYYLFSKADGLAESFLTVRRKDAPASDSLIIFAHSNGGMALSKYILVTDRDTGINEPNINLSLFMDKCFESGSVNENQKVLVVWDQTGDKDKGYIENLVSALKYAKIDFDIIRMTDLDKILYFDVKRYNSIALLTELLWQVERPSTIELIEEYVKKGGGLLVAYRCENKKLNKLFGIEKTNDFYKEDLTGLKIVERFFPGSDLISYPEDDFFVSSLDVELTDDAKVIARAITTDEKYPGGVPLAWIKKYGSGQVVYWNSDSMRQRRLQGILLQSLLLAQGTGVYSLANIENIHMDDSPQPMYNVFKEPIKSAYNLTDTQFYMNVWWKDMVDIAKEYDIKFTFYAIFDYSGRRKRPFSNHEFKYGADNAFGRLVGRIIDQNYELGLHGYNHQPLILKSRYDAGWQNRRDIEAALYEGRQLWEKEMPDVELPFSYVAPMNVTGPSGKKALHKVFPEIKVISQVFSEPEPGYRQQDFGPDKDVPELFDIPRVTSGHKLDQDNMNKLLNLVNTFGVWTHFFHPDDVFGDQALGTETETLREMGNWKDMVASTKEMFSFVRKNFPWLRNMTTKDAYYEFIRYFDRRVKVAIKTDVVEVEFTSGTTDEKYFCLRIDENKRIEKIENCEIVHSYKDINMFVLMTEGAKARIMLADKKAPVEKVNVPKTIEKQ